MAIYNYEWGNDAPPAAWGSDGALWVDKEKIVYEWDNYAQVWNKNKDLSFEEILSFTFKPYGATTPTDIFSSAERPSWLRPSADWDDFLGVTSFIELTAINTATSQVYILGRIARPDHNNFAAWISSLLPNPLTASVTMRIYNIVDDNLKPSRVTAWNALFGAMRGRGSYHSSNTRSGSCGGSSSGYPDDMVSFFQAPVSYERMMYSHFFNGVLPNDDKGLIWINQSSPRNYYSQPKDYFVQCDNTGDGNRKTVDKGTNSIALIQGGHSYSNTYATGLMATNPSYMVARIDWSSSQAQVKMRPPEELQGCAQLFDEDGEGHSVCAVYAVQGTANEVAFAVKPLGVDRFALTFDKGISQSLGYNVFARVYLKNAAKDPLNILLDKLPQGLTWKGWEESNSVTINRLALALWASVDFGASRPSMLRPESMTLPSAVRFAVMHYESGKVGPLTKKAVRLLGNKKNAAIQFMLDGEDL